MLVKQLRQKVEEVLESSYSSYAIAKFIGDASANNINNLRSGKSRLEDIKFSKLEKIEYFYETMVKIKVELVEVTNDSLTFECKACGKSQTIVSDYNHVLEMEKEIESGVNPFVEGWEDGIGNTVICQCEFENIKFYIDTPTGFSNDRVLYATKSPRAIEVLEERETTVEVTEEEAKRQLYRGDEYAPSPAIQHSDITNLSEDWETYVSQMIDDSKYRFR